MKKILTLSFIIENNRILLAMKKRGFGAGRYNGYGGKVEEGETIEEGAIRELREESGLEVERVEKVGIHEFEFAHDRGNILEVHVFHVTRYTGEAVETEEMKPEWFSLDAIPFENMCIGFRSFLRTSASVQSFFLVKMTRYSRWIFR